MKVLIADDEPLAARRLIMELSRRGDVEIVGPFSDGPAARAGILESKPDVALLDVQMPGMTGFETLDGLSADQIPLIIFVTAYQRYAVPAFRAGATDYLLKPIDSNALGDALDRAKLRLSEQDADDRARELKALLEQIRADTPSGSSYKTVFWVKSAKQNMRVRAHEVDVFEAVRDYVLLHVRNRSFLMRAKISELEKELDPDVFIRVHRSFIVNLDFVASIGPAGANGKAVTLTSGRVVRIGRTYASAVAKRF